MKQKVLTRSERNLKNRKMITVAVFGAMAFVSMLLLRIPVGFLTLDFKDIFITVCGLAYGPMAAFAVSLIVPLIEMISVSSTGVYGMVMNFLSSAAFSVVASLVYKYKKTLFGAVCGLICGVFSMTAVMMIANLIITPFYMHVSVADVAALIPKLLLPFNLTKAVLNAALVLMLYKPISTLLKKMGMIEKGASRETAGYVESGEGYRMDTRSRLVLLISGAIAVAAIAVIILVLGGHFSFFDVFRSE